VPPAAPHTGGRHRYNGVLFSAPRASFTTLPNNHHNATQPSERCLTPWLRCFGPVENETSRVFRTYSHFRVEGGIPDCKRGATLAAMRLRPEKGGGNLPLLPTRPHRIG
jgi:hypothetical protein